MPACKREAKSHDATDNLLTSHGQVRPVPLVFLPPTKEEVNVCARVHLSVLSVCLSVCLLAILLKNAYMDLDEMLRVNRCWDMDELINFRARSGL